MIGMANYGFMGTVSEFIDLCDKNTIAEVIRDSISPKMKTTHREYASWRDGLQKLSNYLRILGCSDGSILDLGIICELCYSRGRADVILTGRKGEESVAVVMEVKQWSIRGIASGSSKDRLMAHVGNEKRSDKLHPVLQAISYSASIRNEFDENELILNPIAFLPNMESNRLISQLNSVTDGENLFLKPHLEELGIFLGTVFSEPDTDLNICRLITKADYSDPEGIVWNVDNEEDEEDEEGAPEGLDDTDTSFGWLGGRLEFIGKCEQNLIGDEISLIIPRSETSSEFRSWRNGLYRLSVILRGVEANVSVACEVGTFAGRADVILMGRNREGLPCLVVIELKQWSDDGIGNTVDEEYIEAIARPGPMTDEMHPLRQAIKYHNFFRYYKQYFERDESEFETYAIAFLPNTGNEGKAKIESEDFSELLDDGRVFCMDGYTDFTSFLNDVFHGGDPEQQIIQEVISSESGATRHLMLHVNDMVRNPRNLVPTSEQQEAIDAITKVNRDERRQVIVVQGNPGTGKTIVGLRSILQMIRKGDNFLFASANTAALRVLKNGRLRGDEKKLLESFLGSMVDLTGMISEERRLFDVLVIDEAQSITPVIYTHNIPSIATIIASSMTTVFLLDERQRTDFDAHGTVENIITAAEECNAILHEFDLSRQFRCGENSNYLEFVGSLLYGDVMPERMNFTFEVFDDANALHARIIGLDSNENTEAALIAPYCWPFISKKKENSHLMDIKLANGFEIQWNQEGGGGPRRWMGARDRIDRAGYPPEIQGQELTYAGVILGPDLILEDGQLAINPWKHAMEDQSAKCINPARGKWKKGYNDADEEGKAEIERKWRSRIRNQYWVLLSRGSSGCFVYSDDDEVRQYFKDALNQIELV